jgi:hypothetical protein
MLKRWPATWLYIRDLAHTIGGNRSRVSIRWLSIVIVGILVLLGIVVSIEMTGWLSVAAGIAVNVAASAVVAGTTVAGLLIGSRRHTLNRLLRRQAQMAAVRSHNFSSDEYNRAIPVSAQLTDRQQAGYILIETSLGSGREGFIDALIDILTKQGVVTVLFDPRILDGVPLSQGIQGAFRRLLALAGAADAPFARTFESLASRRRLVAIIDGLDEIGRPTSKESAISLVRSRVDELRVAGLPVAAVVEAGSVPSDLSPYKVTLPNVSGTTILALASKGPEVSLQDEASQRPLSAARRLAATLQDSPLHLRTIETALAPSEDKTSEPARSITRRLDEITRNLSAYGQTLFIIEPLRTIGFVGPQVGPTPHEGRVACQTLQRIGQQLLFNDTKFTMIEPLVSALPYEAPSLLTGLEELERLKIVERRSQGRDVVIRFTEPTLREVVVGVCAATCGMPFGFTLNRTSDAFVGEALQRVLTAGTHASREWQRILDITAKRGALVIINELKASLSAITQREFEPDIEWLSQAWENSSDSERIAFVRRLPTNIPESYVAFLWRRLKVPMMDSTPHAVRRAIAKQLGAIAEQSWPLLRNEWAALVSASQCGGLAWHQRKGAEWKSYGNSLASLCWLLPSVALMSRESEGQQLLADLLTTVVPGGGPEEDLAPDVGIEISLAEGAKDMTYLAFVRGISLPEFSSSLIIGLANNGRSWVSRMLAMQSSIFAAAADECWIPTAQRVCEGLCIAEREHPIVKEYAGILLKYMIACADKLNTTINSAVWHDDIETLEGAGGELFPEVAYILAETTLILNLVESRIRSGGDWRSAQLGRVTALVEPNVPTCFANAMIARAYGRVPCSCKMGLCGPRMWPKAIRPISITFAYRCLSQSNAEHDSVSGATAHLGSAMTVHLKRIVRGTPEQLV